MWIGVKEKNLSGSFIHLLIKLFFNFIMAQQFGVPITAFTKPLQGLPGDVENQRRAAELVDSGVLLFDEAVKQEVFIPFFPTDHAYRNRALSQIQNLLPGARQKVVAALKDRQAQIQDYTYTVYNRFSAGDTAIELISSRAEDAVQNLPQGKVPAGWYVFINQIQFQVAWTPDEDNPMGGIIAGTYDTNDVAGTAKSKGLQVPAAIQYGSFTFSQQNEIFYNSDSMAQYFGTAYIERMWQELINPKWIYPQTTLKALATTFPIAYPPGIDAEWFGFLLLSFRGSVIIIPGT